MSNIELKLGSIWYPTRDIWGNEIPREALYMPEIYKEILSDRVYDDALTRNDMVIIDVGANIGITVDHFRRFAKKVYAIEPSPEHFAALEKNKEFFKWDNVELFNGAISDKTGEAFLAFERGNRTCNSIANNYGQGGIQVKTIDFETFFIGNQIEYVDFMKFDVEGADDMILRSESFKKIVHKIKSIEVEFHNHTTWPALEQYLRSFGFQSKRYNSGAIIFLFYR